MESILSQIRKLIIWIIRAYQILISPLLGSNCRFYPTCSQYGIDSIKQFGIIKGIWLILKRILKCNSFIQNKNIDSKKTK